MTRGTITIKRTNGIYDQLWYVNADGYIKGGLGEDILKYLKTANDIERAIVIFGKAKRNHRLEIDLALGETDSIEPILKQYNDYSYVFDEKTEKWGFYKFKENKLHNLESEWKKIYKEENVDFSNLNPQKIFTRKDISKITTEMFSWKPEGDENEKLEELRSKARYLLFMIYTPELTANRTGNIATLISVIDLETKKILNWTIKEKWNCKIKTKDSGSYYIFDKYMNFLTGYSGYVPEIMPTEHCGDYVELEVNADGVITNWDKDLANLKNWEDFWMSYGDEWPVNEPKEL